MAKIYHHPDQITVWDILGAAPWEMKAPPRELPEIAASQPVPEAAPSPVALTPEELAEVEHYAAHEPVWGPSGDAAMQRWDAWLAGGRAPERAILRPAGAGAVADVEVMENRLGWAALVRYADDRDVDARSRHGHVTMPDSDGFVGSGLFFWRTRDAAIAYCAHEIWRSFNEDDGSTGRLLKRRLARAENVARFFQQCGIDVMTPPSPSLRRIIVTAARERELRAGVAPAPGIDVPGVERALMARFEGVIDPPSELTLKRRKLKREREEA
ncbi:hypothetical protein [Methylobacterium ajmalii]|uniref:hypothetical protein n=2 Tax=Methylobacterium ajmalii TaxID=2738439 RepID=UPI00190AF317|nr:hypothetical protein [Methylobacterium ajmalii]